MRVFAGNTGRALTLALSDEIQKLKSSRDVLAATIIVPSQAARYWLLKQLAQSCHNDLVGVSVITLYQFALDIFSRLGMAAPKVTEDKRYISLVWQLLNGDCGGFSFPVRDPYPTVRALYNLLRELRDAGLSAEEASRLTGEEPYEGLTFLDVSKARKVFSFYKRYAASLRKHKWLDTPGLFNAATEILASRNNFKMTDPIFVWGFYDFVGTQKDFLRELVKHAALDFFLPEAPFTQPLIEDLLGWGFKRVSRKASETLPSATILKVALSKDEAWAIAHKICDVKKARKASWDDFCVIFRKPEDFLLLKRAFLELRAPFVVFEDSETALSRKPLGQAIIKALKFLEKPSAKSFLDIVASQSSVADKGRKELLLANLSRFLSLDKERLFSLAGAAGDFIPEAIKLDPQVPRDKIASLAQDSSFFIRLYQKGLGLCGSLNSQGFVSWLDSLMEQPREPQTQRAYSDFKSLLAGLPQEAFASRPFLINLIQELLDGTFLESPHFPRCSSGVWLVSANQARGADFPYVFIFGSSDGSYPLSLSEDPFLSSGIRERLHQLGVPLARPGVFSQEEALLFELLKAVATEELFISYSQMDAAGQLLLASPFIKKEPDYELAGSFPEDKMSFLQGFCLSLLLGTDSKESVPSGGWAVSCLSRESWKAWLRGGSRVSPSLLADYLSCPQAFFWRRVQKLSGMTPESRYEFFPASALGEFFAQVFVEFLKGDSLPGSLTSLWQACLKRRFPQLETSDFAPRERYKMHRVGIVLEDLGRDLEALKDAKGFEDIEREKEFDISWPDFPFLLKARVDAYSPSDYFECKLTSRSVFGGARGTRLKPAQMLKKLLDPTKPEGGRYGWQILFYLASALTGGRSGSVFLINPYWEISSTQNSPKTYSWSPQDELESLLEELKKAASLYSEGIASPAGLKVSFPFWPHEKQGQRCGFCPFQPLCLKDISWIRLASVELARVLSEFHGGN